MAALHSFQFFAIFLILHSILIGFEPDYMRGSRKLCQRGSYFDNVYIFIFLVDEEREEKYPCKRAIIGQPAKRQ